MVPGLNWDRDLLSLKDQIFKIKLSHSKSFCPNSKVGLGICSSFVLSHFSFLKTLWTYLGGFESIKSSKILLKLFLLISVVVSI